MVGTLVMAPKSVTHVVVSMALLYIKALSEMPCPSGMDGHYKTHLLTAHVDNCLVLNTL